MMSATSFTLARRMTEKNEPDMLRKYNDCVMFGCTVLLREREDTHLSLFSSDTGIFFFSTQRKISRKVSRGPAQWRRSSHFLKHCSLTSMSIHHPMTLTFSLSLHFFSRQHGRWLLGKDLPATCSKGDSWKSSSGGLPKVPACRQEPQETWLGQVGSCQGLCRYESSRNVGCHGGPRTRTLEPCADSASSYYQPPSL